MVHAVENISAFVKDLLMAVASHPTDCVELQFSRGGGTECVLVSSCVSGVEQR